MAGAELGPQDIPKLLEILQNALNQNAEIQKSAEAVLQSLGQTPGFCACLAEIIANKQADHSARWLASVQFKNMVQRRWKVRGGLSDAEKAYLRGKVFDLFGQEDTKIAVQIAVAMAKIARVDYPRHWPNMISDILQKLQGDNVLVVRRTHLVIHHVLKELASKRLMCDQTVFAEVTNEAFGLFLSRWYTDTQALLARLPEALQAVNTSQPLVILFERWLLELKALRRMLVSGYPHDAETLKPVPQVLEVIPGFLAVLQHLMPLRPTKPVARTQPQAMLDRGIIKLAKSLRSIVEAHPWAMYQTSLFPVLDFLCTQLVSAERDAPGFDLFLIECIRFVAETLESKAYKGKYEAMGVGPAARAQEQQVKAMGAEAKAALATFWDSGRLSHLAMALVQRYFVLTDRELDEWEDNPEQFQHQAMDTGTEADVRSCAENLLAALMKEYEERLVPTLLHMLQDVHSNVGGQESASMMQQILKREAVYNAVCVAQYSLHDHVDFSTWLNSNLLKELTDTSASVKPLRRRIVLLIGAWSPKLTNADRGTAYRILTELLGDDDLVIQLAAVHSLFQVVDQWEFAVEQFLPYVQNIIESLATMLQQVTEVESQQKIFLLMNLIIEKLGDNVKPCAERLLQMAHETYCDPRSHSVLRIQVLATLQLVVNALGTESGLTYPLLLPVLRSCTDRNQEDALNLLEDGLQLWLVALRNAVAPEPQLLALFPNLVAAMNLTTEHVVIGAQIMSSCVLLGGADFLQHYGQMLVGVLCQQIGSLSDVAIPLLCPVFEVTVQLFPAEGAVLLDPALQQLFAFCLSGCSSKRVNAAAFAVFARILLQNPAFVPPFLERAAPHVGDTSGRDSGSPLAPHEKAFLAFVDLWLEEFDRIGSRGARKLCGLALCNLFAFRWPSILTRLSLIVAAVTGIYFETEGLESDAFGTSLSIYDYFGALSVEDNHAVSTACLMSEDAEGEGHRRRLLVENDPVNTLKVSTFLNEKLGEAGTAYGAAFQAAIAALDPTLSNQLMIAVGQAPREA